LPEIRPFPGVFYRVPEVDLEKVLAPPYDVIPPAYQDALYARDPRNIVRVVLNREPGDAGYADAGATYARWLAEGLLAPDPEPALYLLEQTFRVEVPGHPLHRFGLLARVRAEDPEKGVILPHEHTRKAAKEDRWRVLNATRANFSPIFMMFPDAAGQFMTLAEAVAKAAPALRYTDDGGVGHRLWRVPAGPAATAFVDLLGGTKAYIADGHHRYATALRYRDATGPDGAFTLGYFTPMEAAGLVIQPYHRILSEGPSLAQAKAALAGRFVLTEAADVAAAARAVARSTKTYAFALAWAEGGALVAEALPEAEKLLAADTPKSLRALDTYFLHQAVLRPLLGVPDEAVSYVHSLLEAEEAVEKKACRLAVLLRGTPAGQIVDVAEAKESMPAKSTFFYPKLPSGLVIHPLLA
jgi:uncharacterized protein (DUF1015 family)